MRRQKGDFIILKEYCGDPYQQREMCCYATEYDYRGRTPAWVWLNDKTTAREYKKVGHIDLNSKDKILEVLEGMDKE